MTFELSSTEAESAVLGSMLIDPGTVPGIVGLLRAADFGTVKHGWVFAAIQKSQRHRRGG